MELNTINKDPLKLAELFYELYGWEDKDNSIDYEDEDSINEIIKNYYDRISNFFSKINASEDESLINRINNLSDELLIDLIFTCSLSNERIGKIGYQWIREITKYSEIEFSKMDEFSKNNYDAYYEELKRHYIRNANDFKNESVIHFQKAIELLDLIEELGHPFNFKRKIVLNKNQFDFSPAKKCMNYNNYLNTNLNIAIPSQKLNYILLSHCSDELIRYINTFFDGLFIYWKDINLLKEVINKITIEIDKMYFYINKFKPLDNEISEDEINNFNYLLNFEFLQYRKNRDNKFKSLFKLKQLPEPKNEYNVLNYPKNSSINKNIYSKYLVENDTYNINTIKNNTKLLFDFADCIDLNNYLNLHKHVPNIHYILDVENILDFKILYHEFIELGNEFKDKKYHKSSKDNLKITKVLKNIMSTIEDSNLQGSTFKYSDPKKFSDNKNEKNILRYYQSFLLSEKIRRGFFREYNMMEAYSLIYDFQIELRDFLTSIFYQKNISINSSTINNFYKNIVILLEDLSKEIQIK